MFAKARKKRRGGDESEHEESDIKHFDLLNLPEELVMEVLLKQCARRETILKATYKGFNSVMESGAYKAARQVQKTGDREEPEYCAVHFHTTWNSQGWDPAAEKWCSLPSLDFLANLHDQPTTMKPWVECSSNGLLCVTMEKWYTSTMNLRGNLRDIRTTVEQLVEHHTYVCNPLTKSYVKIDTTSVCDYDSIVLRAGDVNGKSGFTLIIRRHKADPTKATRLYKLESNNLDAGWQPLAPLPSNFNVWAGTDGIADFVLVDGAVHLLGLPNRWRNYDEPFTLMLAILHLDRGLWESHEVVIPGRRPEFPALFQNGHILPLLQVGGKLWLVKIRHRVTNVSAKSEISICRYEPEERKFILVEKRKIPMCSMVRGNNSTSKIIFIVPATSRPMVYDVLKLRWLDNVGQPRDHKRLRLSDWIEGSRDGYESLPGSDKLRDNFHLTYASLT